MAPSGRPRPARLRVRRRRPGRPGRPGGRPGGSLGRHPGLDDAGRDVRRHVPPPGFLACWPSDEGPRHLDADFEFVRETFHRFAEDQIRPRAEHVHRANADIPEEIISGLAELGGFGLSVPEEYGGFATGGESDYMGMVVATEELTWGSLGLGGSLITRPEILTRALVDGRHRGAEAATGCRGWLAARSWRPSPSPSPTSAPTSPADHRGHHDATAAGSSTASRPGAPSPAAPTCSCCSPAPTPTAPRPTGGSRCSWCEKPRARATASSSPKSRGGADQRSARAARGPAHRHHRVPGDALLRARPSRTGSSPRTTW